MMTEGEGQIAPGTIAPKVAVLTGPEWSERGPSTPSADRSHCDISNDANLRYTTTAYDCLSLSELKQSRELRLRTAKQLQQRGWVSILVDADSDQGTTSSSSSASMSSLLSSKWRQFDRMFSLPKSEKLRKAGKFRGEAGVSVGYRKVR
jgi:hypothetical protein